MLKKTNSANEYQLSKLKKRIDYLRQQLQEDEDIVNQSLEGNLLWKAIDSKLRKKLAQIENDLADYGKLTHDQIIATLEAKNILLMVLSLPSIAASTTKILSNEIQKCLEEIQKLERRN